MAYFLMQEGFTVIVAPTRSFDHAQLYTSHKNQLTTGKIIIS